MIVATLVSSQRIGCRFNSGAAREIPALEGDAQRAREPPPALGKYRLSSA
jgi:hypothetical protein